MTHLYRKRYSELAISISYKRMQNKKTKTNLYRFTLILVIVIVAGLFGLSTLPVKAQSLDEQIRQLSAQAASQEQEAARLRAEGDSLANKVAEINVQANQIQIQLDLNRAKSKKLSAEIEENKKQLEAKKEVLRENIRVIYKQSSISPLEILASSRNFSDFVNKQQYLDRIKEHIQDSANAIAELRLSLDKQQDEVTVMIRQQSDLAAAVQVQRNEAASLLAQTRGSESEYAQQAKASSAKVSQLKAQQAAALAARYGGRGGSSCGGGYPGSRMGPGGAWGCSYEKDNTYDDWGMYNRECVSYTAFRVAASGRYMPYWGGKGHAYQWPANARAARIPVDDNPRAGDIAILPKNDAASIYYGHAMYVESVNANGTINVSQYNIENQGLYSTNTISKSGLEFIHF